MTEMDKVVAENDKHRNQPTHNIDGGKPICKGCGFKIRGKIENHNAGSHHQTKLHKRLTEE